MDNYNHTIIHTIILTSAVSIQHPILQDLKLEDLLHVHQLKNCA